MILIKTEQDREPSTYYKTNREWKIECVLSVFSGFQKVFACVFLYACIFVCTNKLNNFLFMGTICAMCVCLGGCLKLQDNEFCSRGS